MFKCDGAFLERKPASPHFGAKTGRAEATIVRRTILEASPAVEGCAPVVLSS